MMPDCFDKGSWLHDMVTPDLIQSHSIKKTLFSGKSKFQSASIVDTNAFGICLVLDGKIQSSEYDEFIYHEALVHPAMLVHPKPEKVFIAGGGEGATLREILLHNTVKKVVMVDIDKEVVDICRRFLPTFHRGSFDDTRSELHYADARQYLAETPEKFDVIILDLVEPLEAGPACLLYTREFYQIVKERLNQGGIMSVQAGASGWVNVKNYTAIVNTLKAVFTVVCPYQVYVPAFVDQWGFALASQSLNPGLLLPKTIDDAISSRLTKELKSYDGNGHQKLFALSKHLRRHLASENRILTDANPIVM
jgi:spermidine synthase